MAETTGRIPLWIIGTVTGIPVIGLVVLLWFRFRLRFISVVIG